MGDDANLSVLDEGLGCRVENGYAEMHRAYLGLVRLYRDDDFVRAGGSAVELQWLVEDIGALAGSLPHGEDAEQNKRNYQIEPTATV